MKQNRTVLNIIVVLMIACLLMAWVDAVLRPGYLMKSIIKLAVFLGLPWLIYYRQSPGKLRNLFRWKKSSLYAVFLGACVYGLILGGYFVVARWFDFSQVAGALEKDLGVNAKNFMIVALYISFVNSLLEEFFFRGFGFLTLKQESRNVGRWFSFLSAACFSLYHVAMMAGWFRWDLLTLLIIGLFAAGLLFNWINTRTGTLWYSWLLHMSANFAINTVGFILLGVI